MSGARPWLGVVVPTCNDGAALEQAIASVMDQQGAGIEEHAVELVIVDDGSTDDTPARIERLRAGSPLPCVVLAQSNRGPSAARNAGLRRSAAPHLLFFDADDVLLPGALALFRRALAEHPADMVFGGRVEYDGTRRRAVPQPPLTGDRARDLADFLLRRRPAIGQGCAVYARRVFDRLAWPEDIRAGEDRILHAQVLALFDCRAFAEPVAELRANRARSLGRGVERWRDILASVDRIFDPALMPPDLMALKPEYEAYVHLSLCRLFQRAGEAARALPHYRRALSLAPRQALAPRQLARGAAALWGALTAAG
ncbi:MAG: glycosyltransferase [Alphaproteobacteria bacterium]|nr:glycosyltransferase [Alphaproteobacteria bacterium]